MLIRLFRLAIAFTAALFLLGIQSALAGPNPGMIRVFDQQPDIACYNPSRCDLGHVCPKVPVHFRVDPSFPPGAAPPDEIQWRLSDHRGIGSWSPALTLGMITLFRDPGTIEVGAKLRVSGTEIDVGDYKLEVLPENHPSCFSERKGLTWSLLKTYPPAGTIRVGCGQTCEPRKGDTPCNTALPILCIRKSGQGFPLPVPASVDDTNRYNRWSGGLVATTEPLVPPPTLAEADQLCVDRFGPHWRVAEHHDGWGWAFQAYGGVGDRSARFWVDVNDADGTCWK